MYARNWPRWRGGSRNGSEVWKNGWKGSKADWKWDALSDLIITGEHDHRTTGGGGVAGLTVAPFAPMETGRWLAFIGYTGLVVMVTSIETDPALANQITSWPHLLAVAIVVILWRTEHRSKGSSEGPP